MQVSQAYIQQFVTQLDTLDDKTRRIFQIQVEKLNLEERLQQGEADAFQEVVNLARSIVPANSRLASAMSAGYYDRVRIASKPKGKYSAVSYDTVDYDEIDAAYYSIAKEYASGKATVPLYSLMGDTSSRFTRYASNETVRRNAASDPARPRFAIVPSPTACVFCLMRASNGYTYPDSTSVESHNNCKCQAIQVYGNSTIQGYDPDDYLEGYTEASKAFADGKYSQDMKLRIEAAKKKHDEAYARGETTKKWDNTNAILMIWREQRGEK